MQLSVGAAIRTFREAKNWSQDELGKRAGGLNKETIVRVESGGNTTVDTLLKIARALDASLEITLRQGTGNAQVIRDVSGLTSPDIAQGQDSKAPGEDAPIVPLSLFPSSPLHFSAYGLIGDLTEDQVRQLIRPLMDLVESIRNSEEPGTEPPPRPRPKRSK